MGTFEVGTSKIHKIFIRSRKLIFLENSCFSFASMFKILSGINFTFKCTNFLVMSIIDVYTTNGKMI